MENRKRVKISKLISLLLRHRPDLGGLTPDERGFVPLKDLINALSRICGSECSEELIMDVIRSDEERFEIKGDLVRARYGHSFPVDPGDPLPPQMVPDRLYHGTTGERLERILREGLRPMGRTFVHLSLTPEKALEVARRRRGSHVILVIRAKELAERMPIYRPSRLTFLVKYVPPEFIEVLNHG